MRKLLSLAALSALLLAFATPVIAQEGSMFVQVSSVELAPADADMFLEQVKVVRDAAIETNLDPKYRWDVYRWDNTLYFVSWHETLANLDDPQAFMQEFQGTSAADRVMAAFNKANALHSVSSSSSISMSRPDLSYMPAASAVQPGQHGGIYVIEQWPKGDQYQAFEASVKKIMGMLGEMGGVYPVFTSMDVVGDGGVTFAIPFDNMSNFYGANSLERRLEATGKSAAWGELTRAHQKMLNRTHSQFGMYLPEHSYRPDLADTPTGGN